MSWRRTTLLLAAAAFALGTPGAFAAEEKSLLTPDGTVYVVRADTALNLGASGRSIQPTDSLIEFSFKRQDGSHGLGIVPGSIGANGKSSLDMAYDEASGSLVLLWKEDLRVVNVLHLGIYRDGTWTQSDLLPNLGFAHAFNPQMLLSHQTVRYQDADGNNRSRLRTILSVIWWEEASLRQARYVAIFLGEDASASDVPVYDLPASVGGVGAEAYGDLPQGAYLYPSMRLDGANGEIAASFADLNAQKHYVVRISFPAELGKIGGVTWQRRRIPVVGIKTEAPLALESPSALAVRTLVGPAYNPTLVWRDADAVSYTRYDGQKWSSAKSIALTETMPYEKALRLVEEMASRN